MTFAAEDLKTLLVAHDFIVNPNITVEPSIRLMYEGHPAAHADSGEIVIIRERLLNIREFTHHRTEIYRIFITIRYDGTDPTILKSIMDEIQSAFDTENATVDREYYWDMLYAWNGGVKLGQIRMLVNATKQWVSK